MTRLPFPLPTVGILAVLLSVPCAVADDNLSPAEQTAVAAVDARAELIKDTNAKLWELAEVGLRELQSADLLTSKLDEAGFEVRREIEGLPTAFVASYGSGRPYIGILAEYDALPGLSQAATSDRAPVTDGAPGHGCGHCGLGSGSLGAVLAVKEAMDKHQLPGTIRIYGTPAEEAVIGKVYMLLAGEFKDLDVCLHWHPSSKNEVWNGSSKAIVSIKFKFRGTTAHAAGGPHQGRSALDAVELMNVGVNFMREHVKEDARMHYVITNGGGAPNVVPAEAEVWYYLRADDHDDVMQYYDWVLDIARGAALMTRTKMQVQIDTDCHELIPNTPLSELIATKFAALSPPTHDESERAFARRLQQPLIDEFGTSFPNAIEDDVKSLAASAKPSKGSTDVGDISWFVPTGGLRTACFVSESPGHSWQNVACIRSSIGEKGILYGAKLLATSAVHLFENPDAITAAKADHERRMKDREYKTIIPEGQHPPAALR